MRFFNSCCKEWTSKHGTICFGVFTIVMAFFWLAWEADQFIWVNRLIEFGEDVCKNNPCGAGRCIASDKVENTLGYVCDCAGTREKKTDPDMTGTNCNISQFEVAVPRSCGDWHLQGYRRNGTYMIDVDGFNPGVESYFDPVNVWCEFSETSAFTVIGEEVIQNREENLAGDLKDSNDDTGYNLTQLGLEPAYSASDEHIYNRRIVLYDASDNVNLYNLTMNVIQDILDDAEILGQRYKECTQSFSFKCTNYPLHVYEKDADTTVRRSYIKSGNTDFHMDGTKRSESTEPACTCYDRENRENNCFDAVLPRNSPTNKKVRCNCDASETDVMYDNLTLTTKSTVHKLPIYEVNLIEPNIAGSGETTAEWGEWRISPLVCRQDYYKMPRVHDKDPRELLSKKTRSGLKVIWGILLAMFVITVLMMLCALILLIGVATENCHALLPWMVMVLIFDIMIFIAIVIRAYYLGFFAVVYEIAVMCMWLGITIYGMIVVGDYYSESLNTRVEHM